MALPVILFNAGSGSDSAASGAGPGTALTGTGASLNSTTSIDLSADAPDLSGVATDGSACLWVNTSSGRQFFKITNTNNTTKVVTVGTAASVTESGKTWAIGGKRATLTETNSRKLFSADLLPGWTVRVENGGGTQTISTSGITLSVSGDTTTGHIIIEGDSTSSHALIVQSANAAHFAVSTANYITLRNLKFTNTNGTKTSANVIAVSGNSDPWLIENCIFGDATNTIRSAMTRSGGLQDHWWWRDCEIKYCTDNGTNPANSGAGMWRISNCSVHHNTGVGLVLTMGRVWVEDSVVYANGGDGIASKRGSHLLIVQRTAINGNTGDGIDISTGGIAFYLLIQNNNITANGGYGVCADSGQSAVNMALCDYNNFGTGATANTSGNYLNITAGSNDIAVDPGYADASNGNFEAGTAIKALGYPLSTRTIGANQSATNAFVDIGIQRKELGGGQYQLGVV